MIQACIMGKSEYKKLLVKLQSIEDGRALTGSHLGNLQDVIRFLENRIRSIGSVEHLQSKLKGVL